MAELWREGRARRIDHRLLDRILRLLDRLDQAVRPQDMGFAGTQGLQADALYGPCEWAVVRHIRVC